MEYHSGSKDHFSMMRTARFFASAGFFVAFGGLFLGLLPELFSKYSALWYVFDGLVRKVLLQLGDFYLSEYSALFFHEIPNAFVILPATLVAVAILYGFRPKDTSSGSQTLSERTWAVVAILSAVLIILPFLIDIFMPTPSCGGDLGCAVADAAGFLLTVLFATVPGVIIGFVVGTMLIISARSRALR